MDREQGLAVACVLALLGACGKSQSTVRESSTAGSSSSSGSTSAGNMSMPAAGGRTEPGASGGAQHIAGSTSTAGGEGGAGAAPECGLYEVEFAGACEPAIGLEPNEFGFAWRDAYMLLPCYEFDGVVHCLTIPDGVCNLDAEDWSQRGVSFRETFALGGDPQRMYEARLVFSGVVGGKYYQGGVRDAGENVVSEQEPLDTFYRGGEPIESTYDVWQMTIRDADGEVFSHYYLNSSPQASGAESHRTILVAYEKDIEVPGGGSVEYSILDTNCRAVSNCGAGDLPGCRSPRRLPNEEFDPLPETWQGKPLASYDVLGDGQQPFHAQIMHLRVTKVTDLGAR